MCMTQDSRFPLSGNQMNNSRKFVWWKNNFPWFNSFSPAMSHFRKSTKITFPENPRKIVEFQENRKSSEIVVRGWYMTHFDRRGLLKSKKFVWGRFRNISGLPGPIFDFSWFFRKFHQISHVMKNRFFWHPSPKNWSKNGFFANIFEISKNMILELHFGIFTLSVPQIYQKCQVFEI